jgi:NAD-dependent deacetylase sirtuin 2
MIFHSRCLTPANIDDVKSSILSDKNPECVKCGGLVKPDIVFFGEMLPDRFWSLQVDIFLYMRISKAHYISDPS